MAKIENTQAYPTVVPAMDDLLIATDVSNNNETVTFLVSDLIGGAGVLQGLQSVLDTANTATQNINLTGVGPGGGITVIGTVYPTTITAGGSTGSAGQILSSTGTGIEWIDSPTLACCSWDDTLAAGNIASNYDAEIQGKKLKVGAVGGGVEISTPAVLTNTGTSTFSGEVAINGAELNFNATGQINDGAGNTGTAGQWLTSTGTGLAWSSTLPSSSCCTLQDTIAAGNTSANQNVNLTGAGLWNFGANVSISSAGTNAWAATNTFTANGTGSADCGISLIGSLYDGVSTGISGQILSSTATGVSWIDAFTSQTLQDVLDTGNSATGINANITISGFIKPGQIKDTSGATGSAGQILSSTGSGLAWISNSCCNLQDTLTAGASATTSIVLSGAGISLTAPLVIPTQIEDTTGSTGALNEVLTVDGSGNIKWDVPTFGGVASVTATTPSTSTGDPVTISPTTGAVIVEPHGFGGSSNVGFVPDSSAVTQNTHFLRADGSWQVPPGTAGAVTDFTNANGTFISAGTVNTAATGSITMGTIDLSATGTATATTFLRGDNTWANFNTLLNGTPNQIARFTGTGLSVGDSIISQNSFGNQVNINSTGGAAVIEISGSLGALGEMQFAPTGWLDAMIAGQYRRWSVVGSSSEMVYTPTGELILTSSSVPSPTATSKLDVEGSITMNDGTQVAGYVMTCDANGTGSWQALSASAGVSSLSTNDGSVSTGNAITVNSSATGAVTANVFAYAGGANVGYVPTGGSATTYLRGDGTWATPPGSTVPNFDIDQTWKFFGHDLTMGKNAYYSTIGASTLATLGAPIPSNQVYYMNVNTPAQTTWGNAALKGAMFYKWPAKGECNSFNLNVCTIDIEIEINTNGDWTVEIWSFDPCDTVTPVEVVGRCDFTITGAIPSESITEGACCTMDTPTAVLTEGQALIMTIRETSTGYSGITFTGSISFRGNIEEPTP